MSRVEDKFLPTRVTRIKYSQNRPFDTQIHIVMKTPEQFYMFAFAIAMSKSDQFIEGFFHANA